MVLQDFQKHLLLYQVHLSNRLDISSNSLKAYQSDITQFYNWISTLYFNESTTLFHIMDQFVNYLIYEKKLKVRSIKRKIISIKSFVAFYRKTYPEVPDPFIELNIRFPKSKELPRILNKKEIILLLETIQAQLIHTTPYHSLFVIRDLAIVDLLLCTGIRIGELAKIKLDDLDLEARSLRIFGKGCKERIIYISSTEVIEEIRDWVNRRNQLSPSTSHLFLNKMGNKLSIYGIENIYYKYRNIAGINPDSTPHYLRHTFASVDTFVL